MAKEVKHKEGKAFLKERERKELGRDNAVATKDTGTYLDFNL